MHTLTWILRPIMYTLIYILCSCFSPCALKLLKLLIIYYSTSLSWHLSGYLTAACWCGRIGILFTSWVIYLFEFLLLYYYVTDLQLLSSCTVFFVSARFVCVRIWKLLLTVVHGIRYLAVLLKHANFQCHQLYCISLSMSLARSVSYVRPV